MNNILILYDYRGYLASSLISSEKKVDINLLVQNFVGKGYSVIVKCIHELQFPANYRGWYILYPSSEDAGLFYKDYIEDILLMLSLNGAILLPRFECFRAHHNKAFMELYRTYMLGKEFQTIQSMVFYSKEDVKKFFSNNGNNVKYPLVIKTSAGAGSAGVALAHNLKELLEKINHMGRISYIGPMNSRKMELRYRLGVYKRKILKRKIIPRISPREKIIIQTFIPDLQFDFKVLVFGEKYYILRRNVRIHDFRASGSGILKFPDVLTEKEYQVLDFAKLAYEELNTPLLSIDIAHDGKQCHMVEFQCLNFGPYTLQYSPYYYQYKDGRWNKVQEMSTLEVEIATAVDWFIQKS